jgi:rubredoxin
MQVHRAQCDNARMFADGREEFSGMSTEFRSFMCVVCGLIYDEAAGWPEDGIAPGTRWEDVPETWTCPDCGATKSDFEQIL